MLLTVAVLSVGLAACGSSSSASSSTHAKGSSSSVVKKKEASGLASLDVQLTVINATKQEGALRVSVCDPGSTGGKTVGDNCPDFKNYLLDYGRTAFRTHQDAVTGEVKDGAGNGFGFRGENPSVGRPFIELWDLNGPDLVKYPLSEGDAIGCLGDNHPAGCKPVLWLGQREIGLYRDADTDRVKVLAITVRS